MSKWGTNLPKKAGGRYIITLKTSFGNQVRQAKFCEYPEGNFYWGILPSGTGTSEVIAWFKEPNPYEEKQQCKK